MMMTFNDKDAKRIEDLIRKAGGDLAKEVQLAQAMAKSITDADKAERRGLAAEDENFHSVAAVFFERAKALRGL